jgi:two-component system, OmpR family, alkaline phosphatase synthesis response regulator PhoP
MGKKVALVEDEQDIVNLVTYYLGNEGFTVKSARDGLEGLRLIDREKPDLVILDLMLPEFDGLDVCRKLRSQPATHTLPIIMLTAKGEETDKVVGLEMGADDYLTKPFSPKELAARVKALLRRSAQPASPAATLTYGALSVDNERHEVKLKGKEIQLTAKEFGLLLQLLHNRGRVLTREVLLDKVWGYEAEVTTRTVDVHIRRLREKIPLLTDAIVTVKSLGYKLKDLE